MGAFALWGYDDLDFDSQTWLKYTREYGHSNPRHRMKLDLQELLLKDRPSRREVLKLLGPPDWPPPGNFPPSADCLKYNLGQPWIDYESLEVVFGEDGRVQAAHVVGH